VTLSLPRQPLAPNLRVQAPPAPGRVVIATINRLHGNTGVHTHTAALCNGLRAEGVHCDVVTPFDNPSSWLVLFSVRPIVLDRVWPSQSIHWYRRWHGAALRASLRRYLSAHEVSHIVAQCPVSARAALDVRRALGKSADLKITMVCHFNQSEAHEYRVLGQLKDDTSFEQMLAFEADVMQSVDQVIYVSEWIREVVEQDRNIFPRASTVIHNGIESELEPAANVQRKDIDAQTGDLLLINVGTLEHRKNQLGLLDLFGLLYARQPRVKLVLVGDGPDREAIQHRIEALGLPGRVILLGRRTDVAELMKLADLYVHYSTVENCPMVILEAARAGLPWAAIPAAGIRELQDLIGGCVAINPENLPGSAQTIQALLEDRSRLTELGMAARDHFLAGFTRRTMVRAYLKLLALSRKATVEVLT
jgi:glycosyltransferase involved in cell wall biosynthesis